jgi:hypothetical protein
MTVMNRGRTPSSIRPPKGINVNSSNLHGLAVGPQYPNVFAQFSTPRKNWPDADGDRQKSSSSPTRQEVHHVSAA